MIDPRLIADLSPDQLQQLLGIQQQKALSDSISQGAMAPRQTEMVSGRAVPQSMLGNIARAIAIGGGMSQSQDFENQGNKIISDSALATQKGISDLYSAPDRTAAIARAIASPNPKVAAAAAQLMAFQRELVKDWSVPAAMNSPSMAAEGIRNQTIPATPVPPPPEPTATTVTAGGVTYPAVVNPGEHGRKSMTLTTPPASTHINLPGEPLTKDVEKELAQRTATFDTSRQEYNNAQLAVEALQAGAAAGGGQNMLQAFRKAYQLFGGKPEDLTETTNLQMALGKQILAHTKEVSPVTQMDIPLIANIYGGIETDPSALAKMLSVVTAGAFKNMHDFHSYMDTQEGMLQNMDRSTPEGLRNAINLGLAVNGKRVGREAPKELFGPADFQLGVVDRLKKQNYDITKLNGPGGQPFTADTTFNINPGGSFPSVQATQPSNPPVTDLSKLSPTQLQNLLKLIQERLAKPQGQ